MRNTHKNLLDLKDGGFAFANWPEYKSAACSQPVDVLSPSLDKSAAVGSLGTIASFSGGGSTGQAGTGASGAPIATQVTTEGSSLVINLNWDLSVGSAPVDFMSDLIAAAHFLESKFSNGVTVNLNVGYDEIANSSLNEGALGESETNVRSVSYAALVAALTKTGSTSATDASVLASLPAASPVSGTYWVTTAQAKALGLVAANGSGIDGAVGFAASPDFSYGDTNSTGPVVAGMYDFFGTALHELTEVMGRQLLVGAQVSRDEGYTLLDLLHYSAPATRDFTQSTPAYFSVNGGATNLGDFNGNPGGDAGDWASSVRNNPFNAFGTRGVLEAVTSNDLTEMDAIGWNLTGSVAPLLTPAPGSAPSGISIAPETGWLGYIQRPGGLAGGSPLAVITEVGGAAGDKFSYRIDGPAAASFTLSSTTPPWSATGAVLSANWAGLRGGTNGKLYAITVAATDTTTGVSAAAVPLNIVFGDDGADIVNLASMKGIVPSAPTFIYGLSGDHTLNGGGMTGKLYFDGGAGADTISGGTGGNVFEYGSVSDSTPSAMDIITNFNVKLDVIDFTGLGMHFATPGTLDAGATSIAGNSIGWRTNGGDTFVYVNAGYRPEILTSASMTVELRGIVPLSTANITHA